MGLESAHQWMALTLATLTIPEVSNELLLGFPVLQQGSNVANWTTLKYQALASEPGKNEFGVCGIPGIHF